VRLWNKRILFALIFSVPFVVLAFYDYFILENIYVLELNDNSAGNYNGGLGWLTLDVWTTPHHPAIFFQQLTGVLVLLSGIYPEDMDVFMILANITNVCVFISAGLIAANACFRLGLGYFDSFVLGLLVASMPAVINGATQWGPYTLLAPLFLAFGIIFYEHYCASTASRPNVWLVYTSLGFLVGLYFPSLALFGIIGFLILVKCFSLSSDELDQWLGFGQSPPSQRLRISTYSALAIFFASLYTIKFYFHLWPDADMYFYSWTGIAAGFGVALALSSVCAFIAYRIEPLVGRMGRLVPGVLGPFVWGWLLSANLLMPYWLYSAEGAFKHRSGLILPDTFETILSVYFSHHWHWFLILPLACSVFACIRFAKRPLRESSGDLIIITLGSGVVVATTIAAVRSMLTEEAIPEFPGHFGWISRYFLATITAISIAYIWTKHSSTELYRRLAIGLVIGISAASFYQYRDMLMKVLPEAHATLESTSSAIKQHLSAYPDGRIVCVHARLPEVCFSGYAWRHSRHPRSMASLPPRSLMEGAACYIRKYPTSCREMESELVKTGCTSQTGPALIISEAKDTHPIMQIDQPITKLPFYDKGRSILLVNCPRKN